MKVLTLADVKKHNTENDCWIVVNGKVYDTTGYLDDHPGGPEIITDVAGEDCTEEFDDVGHSEDAIEQLKPLLVGVVGGGDGAAANEEAAADLAVGASAPKTEASRKIADPPARKSDPPSESGWAGYIAGGAVALGVAALFLYRSGRGRARLR